jgi:hypothetical protein
MESIFGFFGGKVLRSTSRAYERVFENRWVPWWREKWPEAAGASDVMVTLDATKRAAMVCLFLHDEYKKGERGKQVSKTVSALRHCFLIRGGDSTVFDNIWVEMTLRACRKNNSEIHGEEQDGVGSGKLQAGIPVLEELRRALWDPEGWEGCRLDERISYVACSFIYDGCYRGGETTENRGSAEEKGESNHCIQKKDLLWSVELGDKSVSFIWGVSALREAMKGREGSVKVLSCEPYLFSNKTIAKGGGKIIQRRSNEEAELLDNLVAVLLAAGGSDDNIFTRDIRPEGMRTGGKGVLRLQVKQLNLAIKEACRSLGLDAERYSVHPLRKGGLSQLAANGATEQEQEARGNWVSGSQTMARIYRCSLSSGVGPLGSLDSGNRESVCSIEIMRAQGRAGAQRVVRK